MIRRRGTCGAAGKRCTDRSCRRSCCCGLSMQCGSLVITAKGVPLDMGREIPPPTVSTTGPQAAVDRGCAVPWVRLLCKLVDAHHIVCVDRGERPILRNLVMTAGIIDRAHPYPAR